MRRMIMIVAGFALLVGACGTGDVGSAGSITLAPGASSTSSAPTTTLAGQVTTSTPPSDPSTTTTSRPESDGTAAPSERFVDVYFIKDGSYAAAVPRAVAGPDVATAAVQALLAGPTPAEREAGLDTAVPDDALLLGITIDERLATIDLSREYEAGGGSFGMIGRLAQVVYTLTQFPSVDTVAFRLDGAPVTVFSGEGIVLEDPVDRSDFTGALPIGPDADAGGDDPVWSQSDLPSLDGVSRSDQGRVVLVVDGDGLNVRSAAGVGNPVLGKLLPGVVVRRTGDHAVSGTSTWAEVATPAGDGWVNEVFLAAVVPAGEFAADTEVMGLLDGFSAALASDGDLRPFTSARGLYISHNGPPLRFPASDLAGILTDPTTYKWPSAAFDMSDPDQVAELPDRTFSEAVADRFVSAYDDTDTIVTVNTPIEAGNSRPPAAAIPFELAGFNYVGVHDPGDNPDFGGLDWTTWYVSIDYENGEPRVVALTLDEWSP